MSQSIPIISIVMPAYNVSKYIIQAIDSVIKQSYTKWELIIVDDCSTDNTYQLVQSYSNRDNRIKLFQLKENSGSAYTPRLKAIELSSGDWILNLDADDYLEDEYLETIYNKAVETQADHVIPQIIKVSEECIPTGWKCPSNDFHFDTLLTGKEACMLTISNWEIGGAGVLIRRENYFTALKIYPSSNHNINADELLTRKLLLVARKVSFCHAIYNYRRNLNSITVKFSKKHFDILDTDLELKKLINKHFTKETSQNRKMEKHLWNSLKSCTLNYLTNKNKLTPNDQIAILQKIKNVWKNIDWSILGINNTKKILLGKNFYVFYLLIRIKYAK